MTRFRLSRRMKGLLAGVAFLFSVGAVSTKLLGSRYTDFCFCSPPLAQPAFTAPDDHRAEAAIIGGALPGRVVAQRAPLQVEVINAEPHGFAAMGGGAMQSRALQHLGVLWGDDHYSRGGSSGNGSFMGGGAGVAGGGVMMGGHSRANASAANHTNKPSSASSSRPAARPSAPPAAPPAGIILPPTSGTFAGNADPVPGFGTGSVGVTPGTTGVTLGGIPVGGGGGGSLSVTPEPASVLLTLTGLFLALYFVRRERRA